MACCFFAAFCIGQLISVCEKFDISINGQLQDSYRDFSSEPERKHATTRLTVLGMTCAACSEAIERNLKAVNGVSRARATIQMQHATIVHDKDVPLGSLKQAIEDAGFDVVDQERTAGEKIEELKFTEELSKLRNAFYGSMTITAAIFGIERFAPRQYPILIQLELCLGAMFLQWRYGWWIHENCWKKAKRQMLSMDTLITASVVLGLALSFLNLVVFGLRTTETYFRMISALVMIVSGGRYLDLLSRRKAVDSTANLYGLLQQTYMARLCSGEEIPASLLEVGDQIIINPYSVIPCDAYIFEGLSDLNESLVTGESLPVPKGVGDFLLAGTRNGQGTLRAIVQSEQRSSFLVSLIDSVANANESKVGIEETVGFVTQYFVAGIITLSFIRGTGVFFSSDSMVSLSIRMNLAATAAMTVLTAACPCALGLSTPSAIMAGLDAARSKGILITGGASTMEAMQNINHIIFDKTGTLTTGKLQVYNIQLMDRWKHDWKRLHLLVCAAEESSAANHPAAQVVFKTMLQDIVPEWKEYKISGLISSFKSTGGQGISCAVDLGDGVSHHVTVGNAKMILESGISCTEDILGNDGGLRVYIAIDGEFSGTIKLADTVKSDASSAILSLRSRGLSISMLTGDLAPEASRISKPLSVNLLAATALPQEKQSHIRALQSKGQKIAMIGDGINDAPSLASADVGIMLSHGHSCFTSGGQVLILSPHLAAIPSLFEIAEQTMKQVRWNLIWAAGYNVIAVGLAMGAGTWCGIVLTPEISAAMMAMSSVAIGYQSMRLRKRLTSDT